MHLYKPTPKIIKLHNALKLHPKSTDYQIIRILWRFTKRGGERMPRATRRQMYYHVITAHRQRQIRTMDTLARQIARMVENFEARHKMAGDLIAALEKDGRLHLTKGERQFMRENWTTYRKK